MKLPHFKVRPGVTLVEMLLYITLMAMMSTTIIPLLFNATESRQRQDAIAAVEQNGAQILQTISQEVRDAERIIYPARGGTGYVLALQTDSGSTNPTMFLRESGALLMIQGSGSRVISTSLVGITSFMVDNTSASTNYNSVAISFGVRRTIRLHQPLVYTSVFEAVLNTFPDDTLVGDDCGCPAPSCLSGTGTMIWYTCTDGSTCTEYNQYDCYFAD